MTHALKTWPELFAVMADGSKTADVRKNDRNFQVGDDLILQEFEPKERKYTGRELKTTITHILPGGDFGIGKHFAVLSYERITPTGVASHSVAFNYAEICKDCGGIKSLNALDCPNCKRDVVQFVHEPFQQQPQQSAELKISTAAAESLRPDEIAPVQEIAPTLIQQTPAGDLPL